MGERFWLKGPEKSDKVGYQSIQSICTMKANLALALLLGMSKQDNFHIVSYYAAAVKSGNIIQVKEPRMEFQKINTVLLYCDII